jgi:hypothetical protein
MVTPTFKQTVSNFNLGDYIRMSVLGGAGAIVAARLGSFCKTAENVEWRERARESEGKMEKRRERDCLKSPFIFSGYSSVTLPTEIHRERECVCVRCGRRRALGTAQKESKERKRGFWRFSLRKVSSAADKYRRFDK